MMQKPNWLSLTALGLALAALAASLTACSPAPAASPSPSPEAEDAFVFTRENFPRLDGSTSTVPLAQAVASVLLGESREEVYDLISFSRTTASYRSLMDGTCDLLLAAEPAASVVAEREERGFQWQMDPFATDALVFVVNADNPVDSLTAEELRQIYTGEITNWSQVGGGDVDILPFQRNPEAGSQTLMEKLVMDGREMAEPPADYIVDSMAGLLEAVREYDGSPGAIGYTVYYYAHDMEMAQGLKVLQVEGVAPEAATIRSGEYPFLNPYYVVTAAGLDGASPAAVLRRWLLGPEGQALVAHEGYVSVLEATA